MRQRCGRVTHKCDVCSVWRWVSAATQCDNGGWVVCVCERVQRVRRAAPVKASTAHVTTATVSHTPHTALDTLVCAWWRRCVAHVVAVSDSHTPELITRHSSLTNRRTTRQARVSKEVQALRDFEQALLKCYQAYLKALLAAATAPGSSHAQQRQQQQQQEQGQGAPGASGSASGHASLATARVAVRCMGQLLVAKPGFNYSSDLLQVCVLGGVRARACACMRRARPVCLVSYQLPVAAPRPSFCRCACLPPFSPPPPPHARRHAPRPTCHPPHATQALVPLMVSADANIARNATAAIQQLLLEDVQCRTALEAVQLVADLVRKRRCVLPASVVQCLLVLRFAAVTPTSQGGEGAGRAGATKNGGKAKVRVAVRVCVCALVLRGGGVGVRC